MFPSIECWLEALMVVGSILGLIGILFVYIWGSLFLLSRWIENEKLILTIMMIPLLLAFIWLGAIMLCNG